MECQAIVRSRSPFDGTIGGADQVLTTAESRGISVSLLEPCRLGASSGRVHLTVAHQVPSVT